MILYIHSNAAYVVALQDTFFLSNKVPDGEDPPINGAVLVECKKLDPVTLIY